MTPDLFLLFGVVFAVCLLAMFICLGIWLVFEWRAETVPPPPTLDRHNCYVDEWYTALKVGQVYEKMHSIQLGRCDGTTYWLVWIHWDDSNACMGWDDLIGFDSDPPERFVLTQDYDIRGLNRVLPPPLPHSSSSEAICQSLPSSTD